MIKKEVTDREPDSFKLSQKLECQGKELLWSCVVMLEKKIICWNKKRMNLGDETAVRRG